MWFPTFRSLLKLSSWKHNLTLACPAIVIGGHGGGFYKVLGMEPRASSVPGKCYTTELQPSPHLPYHHYQRLLLLYDILWIVGHRSKFKILPKPPCLLLNHTDLRALHPHWQEMWRKCAAPCTQSWPLTSRIGCS